MRKEDLNDWTADRLKDEIVNLSDKNFNLEWRIKQFEESEGRWKCEIESLRTENERLNVDNAAYSSANTMYKEHLEECELKNKHLFEANRKLEKENAYLKENVRSQRDKIDSLMKELEEEKGKTITISDGAITMRADMRETINENKSLKEENKALKQRIKDLEDIGNNYEPQFAPDDDISAFNYECVKQWTTEMGCKRKIQELQDQHQQDCIRYNDMRTAYLVTLDELARLREQFGIGR